MISLLAALLTRHRLGWDCPAPRSVGRVVARCLQVRQVQLPRRCVHDIAVLFKEAERVEAVEGGREAMGRAETHLENFTLGVLY